LETRADSHDASLHLAEGCVDSANASAHRRDRSRAFKGDALVIGRYHATMPAMRHRYRAIWRSVSVDSERQYKQLERRL
jgi:hypothetical protein